MPPSLMTLFGNGSVGRLDPDALPRRASDAASPALSFTRPAPTEAEQLAAPAAAPTDVPVHPAAALFPMQTRGEIEELAADIKAHGQREPCVFVGDLLLDGRNRYRAARLAEVQEAVKALPAVDLRLAEVKATRKDVADRIGMSQKHDAAQKEARRAAADAAPGRDEGEEVAGDDDGAVALRLDLPPAGRVELVDQVVDAGGRVGRGHRRRVYERAVRLADAPRDARGVDERAGEVAEGGGEAHGGARDDIGHQTGSTVITQVGAAIASEAVGLGRAALQRAAGYAQQREVFGRPIGQNQGIQHPLAKSWMELEAAHLMVHKAAWLYDQHQACGAEANAAKYLAAEACYHACENAIFTHGGMGYAKEYHVERYLRESWIPRLAPVSPQLILCFIAEKVLGLPKSY